MAGVQRHPNQAVIRVESGHLSEGEWARDEATEVSVRGIYGSSNSGNQRKKNANGNEYIVRGEFSTRARVIPGATRIRIDSLGLDESIQSWEQYQTHSVIYVSDDTSAF
jgi:hypothetical protein